MDTAQWPQGIGVVRSMEISRPVLERRSRPQKDQAPNCPRCNSTNTKFCYYNNYSLSQPRYFCKACRRYWTEGGSLRNVPVGGGSRKNKRPSTSSSSSNSGSANKDLTPDHHQHLSTVGLAQSALQNPKIDRGQDLNLTFPPSDNQDYSAIPKFANEKNQQLQNPDSSSVNSQLSGMELLKSTGITSSRGFGSFLGMPVSDSSAMYSGGLDFKPSLNFSLEGFENGYGSLGGMQDSTGARLLFPVEELKPVTNTTEFEQNRSLAAQSISGYWNGMVGGGGSW